VVIVADEFFEGFLNDYFAECEEHLTGARHALLSLEATTGQPAGQRAIVDDLFRFFHSLKGISAMVGLRPAEQLAHELENYLRSARAGEVAVTTGGISLLIEGTQLLEQIVNAYRAKTTPPAIGEVVERIAAALPRPDPPGVLTAALQPAPGAADDSSAEPRIWACTFAPTRELIARGLGVDAIRKRLAAIGTIIGASPVVRSDGSVAFDFIVRAGQHVDVKAVLAGEPIVVEPAVADAGSSPSAPPSGGDDIERSAAAAPLAASHVVRVDLARLDELMRQVGDLVISRARLFDTLSRLEQHVPVAEWRAVQESAVAIDRQLRTLREGLMRVRLVAIGEIFRRMPFVVRDLARETGKKVTLLLQGQATEIDKYLIERMMDPVLHLVRNAVSHGIESPEERIARGKRPEGTITLSAAAAGEVVTIEIGDDGRGVDAADVAARARKAGLHVPAGTLDSGALLALLCAPGFSTRDDADRASGRGVGMAVVKETVERLSGTIALASEPGLGTRFTIQLPLTLAVADALIGRVGAEAFAVPQSAVREVIEVAAVDVRQLEQNEVIRYRDAALPIVRLSRLFGIDAQQPARFHVFVIGAAPDLIGLAVDRIVGHREIVVRAIADPLARVDGISGATDLGDGRVVLILDPTSITRLVRQRAARVIGEAADWGRVRA
jgi:two-component system chemotaxis sensor kinase CheA